MLRSFRARLAAIATGGLAIRLLYVLVLAPDVRGSGDWQFFHTEPGLLSDGRGFIDPFVFAATGQESATALHPPLWPLVLTPVSLLGGDGALTQRTVGCFLGAAALVVIGLLGRRVGGERTGLAAAGVAAVYPLLVAADGSLMSETLYGLLIAATLLLTFRLRERRDGASAVALGALIGLAALTRSEALALLPLLAIPVALSGGRGRGARVALAFAGCVLVIAPWTARNWIVLDRPVLVSTNDSTVLAGANCPETYAGSDLGGWRFDCVSPRTTDREGVQAQRWREEGLEYMGDHLGELPQVMAVRVLRTWDLYQPRRQIDFAEGRADWAEAAGLFVYLLLVPLAVYGAVLLRRRSRAALLILLAPVALVTISSLIAYGVPRFRHAAEIPIVVLAAYALASRRRAAADQAGAPTRDAAAA